MTKLIPNSPLTRRELARQALAGTAGVLLAALPAQAQVVNPAPAAPPLPTSHSAENATMSATHPDGKIGTEGKMDTEGEILTRLVPVAAGYALSETQAKEAAAQLKDYPGGFAKARAYPLPDSVGPAFAADAPTRKEHVK